MGAELPLAGMRIYSTAYRRSQEIDEALSRRGAEVVHCPSAISVSAEEDEALPNATREIIDFAPDILVVTTGIGLRGWLNNAEKAGQHTELMDVLAQSRIIARGAKAHGAIRAAGLEPEWVAPTETASEIVEYLESRGVAGQKIAIQFHGMGTDGLDVALEALGAQARGVVVYRYVPPEDPGPVRDSLEAAAFGACDAVLFTAAGGSQCWLDAATPAEVEAIRARSAEGKLGLFTVGEVTARPLSERGLTVHYPERFRLGATLNLLASWGQHKARGAREAS